MKKERLEGDGAARLIQLIRQHGYNKDVDIELATVTSAPPDIKLKIDNTKLEIDKDDIVMTETFEKAAAQPGDRVVVASVKNGQLYIVFDKVVTN
jgi:Protein of unknown function (DUF2577)